MIAPIGSAATSAKPLAKAAAGFEAIFLRMMLRSMREASPDGGLFGDAGGFRDMQDATTADVLSARGLLGLNRMLPR